MAISADVPNAGRRCGTEIASQASESIMHSVSGMQSAENATRKNGRKEEDGKKDEIPSAREA